MHTRKYHSEEIPDEIEISLNPQRTATEVIMVNATEPADGGYTVTARCDASPRRLDYATIIEAIIALRYTIGAEIALNRLPDDNFEKQTYLAFVDAAKAAAKRVATLGV